MEEVNKLILLKGVPCMGYDILALRKLTDLEKLPRRQLRAGIQAVTYLMVYSSGFGFGSVIWGQEGVSPLYDNHFSWDKVVVNIPRS